MNLTNFGYMPLLRTIILLIIFSLISACGSISTLQNGKVSKSNGGFEITGFLVESDGVTPISGATISMITQQKDQVSIATNSAKCKEPHSDFHTYACTIEDGSFKLNVGNITEFPVTLSIGFEKQRQEIELSMDELVSDLGILTFNPSSKKETIAIVLDFYNPFDEIRDLLEEDSTDIQAAKHQLITEYKAIYNISSEDNDVKFPTFYSLFIDDDMNGEADIHKYDTLYINSRSEADIAMLDQSLKQELAKFIANGGNLFITEWRIEVEQVEPSPDQFI